MYCTLGIGLAPRWNKKHGMLLKMVVVVRFLLYRFNALPFTLLPSLNFLLLLVYRYLLFPSIEYLVHVELTVDLC